MTVAYLIVVGNNVTTSTINDYFGYGPDAAALEDKAQKAYTEGKQRGFFEAGTLLIDIVDSRTNKLLAQKLCDAASPAESVGGGSQSTY